MTSLNGQVALITGAGRGIGLGIAKAFAKEGVAVAITDISDEHVASGKAELEAAVPGVRVLAITADGKDHEAAGQAVAKTIDAFGRLDILVNNAQQFRANVPFEDTSWEDMIVSYESGVFATFRFMQAAFPHLKKNGGTIINMGSGAGTRSIADHCAYGSNKEAIRGLSRHAAREWGKHGITVNAICPFAESAESARLKVEQPELIAQVLAANPIGRYGDAELNIGGLCVFLAQPAGRYMTGATLEMNGGSHIRP